MGAINFIGGSEPYLVDYHKNRLIGKFEVKELNYMEATAFSEDVYAFLFTFPMGDDRKVAFISIDSLNELNTPLFKTYKESPSSFADVVVRFRAFDGREAFFKELKKEGLLQIYDKDSVSAELSSFIAKQASKKGAVFADEQTLALFLERENYNGRDDITLYNLLGDLNNLIALGSTITKEMILSVIPENANERTFEIAKMIVSGNISQLRKQAALCRGNEIGTLSALLWEYRIAYKAHYFSPSQIGASRFSFKELSKEQLLYGIELITDAVKACKDGSMPKDTIVEHTFLKLAHKQKEDITA